MLLSFEGGVSGSEGPGPSPTSPSPQLEEMDPRLLEFEADPPNWREMAPPEALGGLGKKETKRQEVINGEDKEEMLLGAVIEQLLWKSGKSVNSAFSLLCSLPSPRVVCNRTCPRTNAQRPSDGLLQASGEGGAPDLHRCGHHFPQPGWDHWRALWAQMHELQYLTLPVLVQKKQQEVLTRVQMSLSSNRNFYCLMFFSCQPRNFQQEERHNFYLELFFFNWFCLLLQILFMQTWRNCARMTTSLSNPSAPQCSA